MPIGVPNLNRTWVCSVMDCPEVDYVQGMCRRHYTTYKNDHNPNYKPNRRFKRRAEIKPCVLCETPFAARSGSAKYCTACRELNRRTSRLCRFGITAQQYDAILARQNGVCAICRSVCKSGRKLSVDHDHKTGFVRGLLCSRCNIGVGQFDDNYQLMQKAATYMIIAIGNQALKTQGELAA